ncbi:hypothetical protein [Streptomyces noursei]|uniref:hypothetical protein n=1 Tax=Streptomyces noursei TaxID=1971 RepID=UPI0023B8797F|nr:hypothetical protein [Streptomyces noursei]
MSAALPRTIRAVNSDQLLLLEEEAARWGFSQRLQPDWLREHVQAAAAHYLFPVPGDGALARASTGGVTAVAVRVVAHGPDR